MKIMRLGLKLEISFEGLDVKGSKRRCLEERCDVFG